MRSVKNVLVSMVSGMMFATLLATPALADEEGLDQVYITELTGNGDLERNVSYHLDHYFNPEFLTKTAESPTRIWTRTSWYCLSGGEKVGPLFTQGQSGVWFEETELLPYESGTASVFIEVTEGLAVIFNSFDCDEVDHDFYFNQYNIVPETSIVGVEVSGEILRGDDNPYHDSPPATYYFSSYIIMQPEDGNGGGTGGCDVTFSDVPCDFVFHEDVEWLAESGITKGCNPPDNTLFCPNDNVTRGQMAAFLVRGLELPPRGYSEYATYADVGSTHVFFDEVGILGAEGITKGCNPPDNSRFCPNDNVTRGQMAAFLVRALGLSRSDVNSFTDDDDSVFEADIQALAASGITRGCNPPANDRFCPNEPVTRGQMAAFLKRALSP